MREVVDMKHEQLKDWAGALSMLRVFRLNPAFELDINPINVMYIDIKHEDEIKDKYITDKGDLSLEFQKELSDQYTTIPEDSFYPLYLYNYLVLQEKGEHNLPTISDVEVVKSMPGCHLPYSYVLSCEDFNNLGYGRLLWPEKSIKVDRPSEFVISIRSMISDHEKLTVDQNEALSCAIAYFHPRPLPRLLLIEGDNDEQNEIDKDIMLNGYPFRALLRDSRYIQRVREGMVRDFDCDRAAPLVFIRVNENEYEATLMDKTARGEIFVSRSEIPPPLHSELFYKSLFFESRQLAGTTSDLCTGLGVLWDSFHKYHEHFYKGAYIPHMELLMGEIESESEELSDATDESSTDSD